MSKLYSKPKQSQSSATPASGGIGFWGLLQIVLITLKLCNVIQWSWWWVLSPALAVVAILVALLLFIVFCFVMARFFN